MIRLCLAAVLAVALVTVSVPTVEDAGTQRASVEVRGELERLATAATRLARHSDPVPPGQGAARRHITVGVPNPGLFGARASVTLDRRLRWRVGPERRGVVPTPVPLRARTGRLRLGPGRHRLTLRYVRTAAGRRVVMSRTGQAFKPDAGTTHHRVRNTRRGDAGGVPV